MKRSEVRCQISEIRGQKCGGTGSPKPKISDPVGAALAAVRFQKSDFRNQRAEVRRDRFSEAENQRPRRDSPCGCPLSEVGFQKSEGRCAAGASPRPTHCTFLRAAAALQRLTFPRLISRLSPLLSESCPPCACRRVNFVKRGRRPTPVAVPF